MITYSIIQKSQLEGAYRLDAEYYQPEILEVFKKINNLDTVEIGSFCRIADGDHSKIPGFVESDGTRYLRAKDLQNFFIDDTDPVYVSKPYFERLKRSHIKPLDIVLSIMGTVGNLAVVLPDTPIMTANRAVSIISPRSQNEFKTYFLAVYLESKYGVAQRERESMGGVQERVNLDDLAKIKVPALSMTQQQKVIDIFQKALDSHLYSESLYQQAEGLLLDEVGLSDFYVEDDLSFVVNLSDVRSAKRIDADYFQPKYKKLIDKIKNLSKGLANIFSIRRGDFISPDYYVDEAKRGYIRIKELPTKGELNLDAVTYIDDDFNSKNLETLSEGDFVFAGIGATLGKTARIPKKLEGSFYSNNTARFRLKDGWKDKIDTRYLQIVFQSLVCQWQFEQREAQTAQAKISDEELKTVLIPVLPRETQQKIAELVRKSHDARKKSEELLEEAKRKVEEMIEKGSES